jgi:hypothetical protein
MTFLRSLLAQNSLCCCCFSKLLKGEKRQQWTCIKLTNLSESEVWGPVTPQTCGDLLKIPLLCSTYLLQQPVCRECLVTCDSYID